jgi:hypothetical protein
MVRKIGPDGTVLFDSLDDGTYVIMIVEAGQVRATQVTDTAGKLDKTNIDLEACKEQF